MKPLLRHLLAVLAGVLICMRPASSAWHEQYSGVDTTVHYVHLVGQRQDNDANRRRLQEFHQACAEANARLGRPVEPLPSGGIPTVVQSHDIDIYYAPGRTVTVRRGILYSISPANCGLQQREHAWLDLGTPAGKCEIDLINKEMRGPCATGGASAQPQPASRSFSGTGIWKTIAGQRCELYRYSLAPAMEKCVARPDSAFPILAAPLHQGIPGLLLDLTSPAMSITAQQVILNLGISSKALDIPSDTRPWGDASGKSR